MTKDYSIVDSSLIINEGRIEIKSHEFFGFEVNKVIIPEGVTTIGYWGFGGCEELEDVVLPASLISIAPEAFALCPLKNITFVDGCPNLKEVYISSFGHRSPWTKQQLEEKEYVSFGAMLFMYRKGSKTISVPDGFEIIGESAFTEDTMEEVIIPEGVKSIGRGAFSGCKNLKTVKLPSSLETIGDSAFSGCKSLTEMVLPEGLKTIGSGVFRSCAALEKVVFPTKVKAVGEGIFDGGFSSAGPNLKAADGLITAMLNGCKINTKTSMWLLNNLWTDESFLKEIVVIYLTQSGTKVLARAETIMERNFDQAVCAIKEIQNCYKMKPAMVKKMDAFIAKHT